MATSMREEIKVGELAIRFVVEGGQTAGSVAAFEFDVPAGAKVAAAHSHDGYDETIYGLEGILTWTVEGTPTDVGPGEALCIPRGAVHHFDTTLSGLDGTVATEDLVRLFGGVEVDSPADPDLVDNAATALRLALTPTGLTTPDLATETVATNPVGAAG